MSTSRWEQQESWQGKSVGNFPYHPLVYHLDLSIFAYQLHTQTLVWPFDPYYEELGKRRDPYIDDVRAWAKRVGPASGYRGPGALGSFPDNERHEPVVYRYAGIRPWSDAVNCLEEDWLEMRTPASITAKIRDVYVCYRRDAGAETDVVLKRVGEPRASGTDLLIAFEGGTGDKGDEGQPASQSIMGFVLARTRGDVYDVHIAFRGSRSGKLRPDETNWGGGTLSAVLGKEAAGNPDWITDLGHGKQPMACISTTGDVHRGFATAMRTMRPAVVRSLEEVAAQRGGRGPESIYVTGHSLGAGLAQMFVSAVLLGDTYSRERMPKPLRAWPWKQIKLITYSAPRAGNTVFARELTQVQLQSQFFTHPIMSRDADALPPTDGTIVPRLSDPARPAAFRVLHTRDPVTSEKWVGGKHVGTSVYVNTPSFGVALSFDAHKPSTVREILNETYRDARTPPGPIWHNRDMAELNPERDAEQAGSDAELQKRADALERWDTQNKIEFDHAAYREAVKLRFEIGR